MTYLPNADAERTQMLKALELNNIDGLFRHLPDALRLDRVDLPEPLSEVELVHYIRELGRLNARINAAKVDYMPGKVETVLRQIRLDQYQAAMLDPPRAGCEPAALSELIRLGVQRLVYVSCEPSTHARDLIALVRGGYRVRRAAIVDMFPQTYHIESVALLERS